MSITLKTHFIMAIDQNNKAATPFGLNNFNGLSIVSEAADRVNDIGYYLSNSPIYTSEVTNFGYLITLPPVDPLPTGVPTGSVAMSGSNANLRMYVYGYGTAGTGVAVSGWRSITPTA